MAAKTDLEPSLERLVLYGKALADLRRVKILALLSAGEMCVCELAEVLQVTDSAVSQHMARLKAAGLVRERRSGQWVYYRMDTDALQDAGLSLTALAQRALGEWPELAEERERLARLDRVITLQDCRSGKANKG